MSYIYFDKTQLVNLEYSLNREYLRANKTGAYASSTIINCNTRKYHGLLVAPQPQIDDERHVLLSSLDETVIHEGSSFNLGIHKYPGAYNPKGHKYLSDFQANAIPQQTYSLGGIILDREILLMEEEDRTLIRYTLKETPSPITIRFSPFLAFRNFHKLSKANVYVEKKFKKVSNGIKLRIYSGYNELYMQFSKPVDFVAAPDWYYNIEYIEEKERGYDYLEDLYIPGFFERILKKGDVLVFSAGLSECDPKDLTKTFVSEIKKRIPRNSFELCLLNAAQQFILKKGKKAEVIAGYHWFGRWGRDTFIALPGLTLAIDKPDLCKAVIDTMVSEMTGSLFPNMGTGSKVALNSMDAPLWFFWTVQKYAEYTGSQDKIWKQYGKYMKAILDGFKNGTAGFNIKMLDNGLIYGGEKGFALTWMDAVIEGKPVTPRMGCPVEINALWYNAVMFCLEIAEKANDKKFIEEWKHIPKITAGSFLKTFWDPTRGYLADVSDGTFTDWSVRPNMVFATSLPYVIPDESIREAVLEKVKSELLTPRGLRTLSPKDKEYIGTYSGDLKARDSAYHQGTVWPWLLGHFVEGYLRIHGKSGIPMVMNIYKGFDPEMRQAGIGTISEVFEGDPPHRPGGAISQAWSVAELLRIKRLIEIYSK